VDHLGRADALIYFDAGSACLKSERVASGTPRRPTRKSFQGRISKLQPWRPSPVHDRRGEETLALKLWIVARSVCACASPPGPSKRRSAAESTASRQAEGERNGGVPAEDVFLSTFSIDRGKASPHGDHVAMGNHRALRLPVVPEVKAISPRRRPRLVAGVGEPQRLLERQLRRANPARRRYQ